MKTFHYSAFLNPIAEIGDNGIIINKRGDYSLVFKMKLPSIHSLSDEDFENIIKKVTSGINNFPEGYAIQRMDFYFPAYPNLSYSNRSDIGYNNIKKLNGRIVMKSESYIVFTKFAKPNERRSLGNTLYDLLRKGKVKGLFEEGHYEKEAFIEFKELVKSFISNVEASVNALKGLRFKICTKQELDILLNSYYGAMNFSDEKLRDTNFEEVDISDLKDRVRIGNSYINVISMLNNGLPASVSTAREDKQYTNSPLPVSWLYGLGYEIDFPHIINQVVYTQNQNTISKQLEGKRKIMIGAGSEKSENRINAAHISEIQEEVEAKKVDKYIKFHLGVILLTPMGAEEYNQSCINKIKSFFIDNNMRFSLNNGNTLGYYYAYYPGNSNDVADLDRSICLSQHAACFGLYESNEYKKSTKGMLLVERKTGMPYEMDIWEHPALSNKNFFIVGPSGTGKSVSNAEMMRCYLDSGGIVVMADVGKSYKPLCELYGGLYMEFSKSNKIRYNPFLIIEKNKYGRYVVDMEVYADDINFIVNILFTAWQGANKGVKLSGETDAILSRSVIEFYTYLNDHTQERPCFTSFYKFFIEDYATNEMYKGIEKSHFDLSSFRLIMSRFVEEVVVDGKKIVEGDYSYLFNDTSNPDLGNNRFILFELDEIKDNIVLFPITYFILTNLVLQKMKKNLREGTRFYYIIDEAWILLSGRYGDVSHFIEYGYRTFRKKGASIAIVTQGINEILDKETLGATIMMNADVKIIKKQSQEQYVQIQKFLNLSEHNMNLLMSMSDQYRDMFFLFKDEAMIAQLHLSDYALGVYTTNAAEVKWIADDRRKTGNLKITIKNFADYKKQLLVNN